jgi:hypothetical protein
MLTRQRSASRFRPKAALLTLASHVVLVLLLVAGSREVERDIPPLRERVSLPITLLPLTPPPDPHREQQPPPATVQPQVPLPERPPPSSAITLPPAEETPQPRPDVDWHGQAARLAAKLAEELERPPPTLGKRPQKMREPCKPPERSFKWKDESPGTGGKAWLTPGWEPPPPDSHLFDDMMAGKRQRSSVPDPNECD